MAPKKAAEAAPVEEEEPQEEEEVEPEDPDIHKKCFRIGSQTYYGDCKLGYGPRKGTYVRHGYGKQVNAAVTPAWNKLGASATSYETSVMGVYEGNWEDDVMSGQGVYSWSDGSQYDGAFIGGKMHGPGRFVWPDGSTYEGTWHSGQMTGHGRLDYRFDGNFYQGRFQRDSFQKNDQRWIDVWQQTRGIEQKQILDHECPAAPLVKRCACGEMYARSPQQYVVNDQIAKLADAIAAAQNTGLMPFIIADESLKTCVLKCLTTAKLADHATQSVSMRMAAIAKRRKRDYNGMFYSAIQASLLTGTMFTLVFEDDDEGCAMLAKEDDRWFDRQPSLTPPTNPLPEQWKLTNFYQPCTFPPQIMQPTLFNGRLMAKLFLPEQLREDAMSINSADLPVPGGSPTADAAPAAEEAPDETEAAPAAVKTGVAPEAAAQAAAALTPAGGVGLTGHVFELPDTPDPRACGLRLVHHLRPAIVALSSMRAGLSDDEVSSIAVERFRKHVPMHRMMLILLTHNSTSEIDSYG